MSDPFNTHKADLGVSGYGTGANKEHIDSMFQTTHLHDSVKCVFCTNAARFRIIPKHEHLNTKQLVREGYICEYCAQNSRLDHTQYGLRDLE